MRDEMKAYLIHTPSTTFGQTDAGGHSAHGQEAIVACASLASSDEEIAAFVLEAGLRLCFKLGNQREAGDQWGEMFPLVEVPVPRTREGLAAALKVGAKRLPLDPYITCSRWGQYRLAFAADAPELHASGVSFDAENLAYQKAVLAGRA
jgi:hypothetical protein